MPQAAFACRLVVLSILLMVVVDTPVPAQNKSKGKVEVTFPPKLPGGQASVTDQSQKFLQAAESLKSGVRIAKTAPQVDFMFYPGQNYPGKPWSNWGDSLAANGKYYSAIGDHLAIGAKGTGEHGTGTGFVFEYDPTQKSLRLLADLANVLKMPSGHYTPGKVHTRPDLGSDGWLYYATHRGSIRATTSENHYEGDWIFRTNPKTGVSEVVVRGPVPKHAIPNGLLDPDRLIFYGGTAPAVDRPDEGIHFFAYDVKKRRVLYSGAGGPARYMMLARSTGRLYYVPGAVEGELMRFDPAADKAP